MFNAALKQVNVITITRHAIERRLSFERASQQEIDSILETSRQEVEDLIRQEIDASIELSPVARRIFIHPGREAMIGLVKPRIYFDRHGRRRQSSGFRTDDSRYFWSGDVIYVVDHQMVVTCILPDERQVVTLFSIMPQAESIGGQRISIPAEAEKSRLCKAGGLQSRVVRLPVTVNRREAPGR